MSSQNSLNVESLLPDNKSPDNKSQEVQTVNAAGTTTNSETKNISLWTSEAISSADSGEAKSEGSSEHALTPQTEARESTGLFEIIRKNASISDLLRLSGAVAVAFAMGLFLLEGIEVVNDLQRFLTMLGLTGALTAAGLLMSALLNEQRGSRVFISLALLSVPVNFTIIGALLYSVVPLDALALSYPGFAHWQVGSISDLLVGLAAGLVVLAPVIWLGFSVLARSSRNWLSIALIASSAILVIPVRGELWSAGLAISATLLLWLTCKRYSSGSLALKTTEGKLATGLLFVAPIIVAVRSLFFYDANGVVLAGLSIGFFACCRKVLAGRHKTGAISIVITLITSAAILGVCVSAGNLLDNFLHEAWVIFSMGISLLLLTSDFLRISPNRYISGLIGLIFAGFSVVALLVAAVFYSGMTLWVGLAMIAMVAYGRYFNSSLVTVMGGIGLSALVSLNASELLLHVQAVWTAALMTGWWGIAAIGVLAIVAGSMIDRAGTVVQSQHNGSA